MFNGDPETQHQSENSEMGEEAADGNGTTQPRQQMAMGPRSLRQQMALGPRRRLRSSQCKT